MHGQFGRVRSSERAMYESRTSYNQEPDLSRSPCLKTVDRKSFDRCKFSVLRPVLLKIAYFNSGNRQLSIAVLPKELRQRKIVNPSRAAP